MVKKGRRDPYPKVVECSMDWRRMEGEEGGDTAGEEEERVYGSPGNLRYFSAFDVSLKYYAFPYKVKKILWDLPHSPPSPASRFTTTTGT